MFLKMRSRANFFLQIQTYRMISFYITKQQQAAVTNRGSFCSVDCKLVEIVTICNLRSASHSNYRNFKKQLQRCPIVFLMSMRLFFCLLGPNPAFLANHVGFPCSDKILENNFSRTKKDMHLRGM